MVQGEELFLLVSCLPPRAEGSLAAFVMPLLSALPGSVLGCACL